MSFTRRETLLMAMGTAVAAAVPFKAMADVDASIQAFTGGADVGGDGITLIAPEIAENGNTVPIEVDAPGKFGALSGAQMASTRIRLAGTQDVVAIAQMPDGSFVQASQEVKVTIGGCGG